MAKVKMSDVKSGSQKVKDLFKKVMIRRNNQYLIKQKYSNEELMEILDISENIERHKEKRRFYQLLIKSQDGPFNIEVFKAFSQIVFDESGLLSLLRNTKGLKPSDKARWIDYAMVTSYFWFIGNFFQNDYCKKFGIDLSKQVYALRLSINIVRYGGNRTSLIRSGFSQSSKDYLWSLLDSLPEKKRMEWYTEVVSTTYKEDAIMLLTEYPNSTPEMLVAYYKKSKSPMIGTHPNCPVEIKNDLFEKTGDEKFLPQEVTDIFLF